MFKIAIFILFLGSGITGLIYQVLWTKLLALTFGVTFLAVSTVLTSFFGGLALGSYWGGRWVDKYGVGLKWYGLAEILIGIYAFVFLFLLDFNNTIYVWIAQQTDLSFYGLTFVKFILSAFILIVPTTLMGATLPILSKTMADSYENFAKDIGSLYSVNTVGAVIGTLATAFYLIPNIGINTTIYLVGAFNIILGSIAWCLNGIYAYSGKTVTEEESASDKGFSEVERDGRFTEKFFLYVVALFALSGFTALVYEVIWTRILGFILTGTIFAFTTVLATFLVGIATGSFVFSRFIDRIKDMSKIINLLALVEILIGFTSIGILILFDKLPNFDFYHRVDETVVWSEFIYLNFLISFIILFVPTFLFGSTFPLVCKIYSRQSDKVGTSIGDIYSMNTVGGIFGSFIGGFILTPFLGMQNSVILMGVINIGLGLGLVMYNPLVTYGRKYTTLTACCVAAFLLMLVLPANMPKSLHRSFLMEDEEILFFEEGPTSTVMVAQRKGKDYFASNKRLWVNGNMATAAFYEGLKINRFQGVLPMVLHPDPKDVLVICFGSGTTFGTLSQFDVTQVDNVELSKTVIKAAPFFKKENRDVLNNPKSRIIIDDGRSYLKAATKKYDVATMEPMHPALAGVVNLYTKEYYESVKAHLKKDGIISQWIPLYSLSVEDVKMMVKTFQSVFPHTTIWFATEDIFMIGSPDKNMIDFDRIVSRINIPHIKKLLNEIALGDPVDFVDTFLMNEDQVRAYAEGVPVLTDSMPIVEFTGPKSLNVRTIGPNILELVKYMEKISPYLLLTNPDKATELKETLDRNFITGQYYLVGKAYFADKNFGKAVQYFKKALQVNPQDKKSLHFRRKLLIYWNSF